ncbi:MAG: DUF4258 domain-containing protein [Planctomycetaceae bacterium]|nr:DUF4258 domain-containing protein [Planctomycetaceae bacterium]
MQTTDNATDGRTVSGIRDAREQSLLPLKMTVILPLGRYAEDPLRREAAMEFELTDHAKTVLQQRNISLDWVERVLNAPQQTEPDSEDAALEHCLGRIEEHGNRVLRVIINVEAHPQRVVTAYFDRAMRNRL